MTRDLRPPMQDETPLASEEVKIGVRNGILDGPIARSYEAKQTTVYVVQKQTVDVINFNDVP